MLIEQRQGSCELFVAERTLRRAQQPELACQRGRVDRRCVRRRLGLSRRLRSR
jgi:hypothetical protein